MRFFAFAPLFWCVFGCLTAWYTACVIPDNLDGAWPVMAPLFGTLYGIVTTIVWKVGRRLLRSIGKLV